jgi:hypothetical protein
MSHQRLKALNPKKQAPSGVLDRRRVVVWWEGASLLPVTIVVVFPVAMAIAMATVVIVADADANGADLDAYDRGIGSRGQKAECKDRRNKRFHGGLLSVGGRSNAERCGGYVR